MRLDTNMRGSALHRAHLKKKILPLKLNAYSRMSHPKISLKEELRLLSYLSL